MLNLTDGSDSDGVPKVKQVKKFMDSLYTTNFAMMADKNVRNSREVRRAYISKSEPF